MTTNSIPSHNSAKGQMHAFAQIAGEKLEKGRKGTRKFLNQFAIPHALARLSHYVTGATSHIFVVMHKSHNLKPQKLVSATAVAIFAVPLSLFSLVDQLWNFGLAAKANSHEAMVHAALLATAAFADVIELPGKVASVVQLFHPVAQMATWAPALSAIGAILSIADIIYTALSHEKTRDFALELKNNSQNAVLTEIFTNERYDSLRTALRGMGPNANKALTKELFKSLKSVTTAKDTEDLHERISKLSSELRNLSLEEWRLLEEVADNAYLKCLEEMEKKDPSVLNRHFQVKGEKLSKALEVIRNSNDQETKFNAVHNLKTRISYKKLSDKLSITSNAITILATVLFVVIAFVAAVTPAAPLAYALLISITIFGLGKIYIDYQNKKSFEKAIGISNLPKPAASKLPQDIKSVPVAKSSKVQRAKNAQS